MVVMALLNPDNLSFPNNRSKDIQTMYSALGNMERQDVQNGPLFAPIAFGRALQQSERAIGSGLGLGRVWSECPLLRAEQVF